MLKQKQKKNSLERSLIVLTFKKSKLHTFSTVTMIFLQQK